MSKIWLKIIGLSEGGIDELSPKIRAQLASAEYLLGSKRLLEKLPEIKGQKLIEWQKPFAKMQQQILALRGKPTIIVATGDANWFGISSSLSSFLSPNEYISYPALSSFQLASAKMHWALQNIDCISLHGRKVENLHKYLAPKNRILALTSNTKTLIEVANLLEERGYQNSNLSVLENLGAESERIISFEANQASQQKIADFYLLAIDCVADKNAPLLPLVAGLPDESFIHDGQLTKREVRASTLAKLAPYPNALLWDIGAGSGSIGIEFMRLARGAKSICFEKDKTRLSNIEKNALALGVPSLEIIAGDALDNLKNKPAPDAIFIGGDVANDELFQSCYKALKIGGRLVANAVTLEGEQALFERHEKLGGELVRIEISHVKSAGRYRLFEPKRPVTQYLLIKGEA